MLDSATTWTALSALRNSFLSRAISALSLSSLILANMPRFVEASGISLGSLRLVLVGSVCFLTGYLLFSWWTPPEFAQSGELHDHVQRMRALASKEFVQSRISGADALQERVKAQRILRAPRGAAEALERQVQQVSALLVQQRSGFNVDAIGAAGLFHADLALRQYDRPWHRLLVAAIMAAGVACLLYPTAANFIEAIAPDWAAPAGDLSNQASGKGLGAESD